MDFFKKNAGSKIEVRNQHSQKHLKEMYLPDPIRRIPTEGYVTIKSVLSDHTAVLFAVPSHEWNELVLHADIAYYWWIMTNRETVPAD